MKKDTLQKIAIGAAAISLIIAPIFFTIAIKLTFFPQ